MKVNIAGLDKVEVLWALYSYALFAGPEYEKNNPMTILHRSRPLVSRQAALLGLMETVFSSDYCIESIDLGQGLKPIYVNLSGDEIDVTAYELHHGETRNYVYRMIQNMRSHLAKNSFLYAADYLGLLPQATGTVAVKQLRP
jgi:hypothetical protein